MADLNTLPPPAVVARARGQRRRWLAPAALALAFATAGTALPVLTAAAQEGGMHGPMGAHGHDPARMQAMMQAHLAKTLDEVGASADQKARIEAIMNKAFASMGAMRGDMHAAHRQLHALLGAPTIDRAALERVRADQMAQLDRSSRVMVAAMADAAEVLTPAQRAKFANLMAEHKPPAGPPM